MALREGPDEPLRALFDSSVAYTKFIIVSTITTILLIAIIIIIGVGVGVVLIMTTSCVCVWGNLARLEAH